MDLGDFKANKEDRMVEKKQELSELDSQVRFLKLSMQQKEVHLEEARRKLQLLRRQNESIKIEEIMQKYFEKRS